MAREKRLFEFDNDYLTYEDIAKRTGLSYQSAINIVGMGITTTQEAKALIKPKARRSRAEIIASLPRVESAKHETPKVEYASNTVVIHHKELDRMLNYLARVSNTTYQAAFEEFVIYLYEGRLWGKEAQSNQEAIAAIKQRLIENHNGRNTSDESYEFIAPKPQVPLKRWEKQLIPYLEELEEENAQLRAKLAQLKTFFGEIE